MMPGSWTSASASPASARTRVRNIAAVRVSMPAFYYACSYAASGCCALLTNADRPTVEGPWREGARGTRTGLCLIYDPPGFAVGPPAGPWRMQMVGRKTVGAAAAAILALAFPTTLGAAPVRLARHPDYHAGRIAFSSLGDIWTANEDGTAVHRLTDEVAREVYPRFSPDGKWIAFASNRYGNYDVCVVPAAGGKRKRLTFHTGNDETVGWTRDSQSVIFRAARGDGAFPSTAVLYQVPVAGGMEKPLPVDWGYSGSFSPDGKSLVFNRHPAVWSRQHYRGSYAADIWVADLANQTYTKLLRDEQYNRYWPMWGADNAIYFVADPLPNDKSVRPGSPEVRKSANNIYKIPSSGAGPPTQTPRNTNGNVFWPSMSSDGTVIVYEDNVAIWKLDVISGRTNELKLDVSTEQKNN